MNKFTSFFISGVLVGALLATLGFSLFLRNAKASGHGDARQRVLKLGHGLDTTHPVHKSMLLMQERLEEFSGGAMSLDIYPSAVLGNEPQCLEQLQNGSLAMMKTSAASMENFIPAMEVFNLPYIFRDDAHFWNVLDGEIGSELLTAGESRFLRGLCYYDAGSRNFYTKDRPIQRPEDLNGLKIRVMNSATAIEMVKAIGGSPTPISWGELYSALAQGTVDGAENNLPSFTTNKHYEVCKHFTMDGHSRVPDLLIVSTKVWSTLSPQEQTWLQQAADQSAQYQRELWYDETIAAREKAEAEGVTIYSVDTALFADKVQGMLQSIKNPQVKSLLQQIQAVE